MMNKETYTAPTLLIQAIEEKDIIRTSLFITDAPDVYEKDPFAKIFEE